MKEVEYIKRTPVRMIANSQAVDRLYKNRDTTLEYIITKDLLDSMSKLLKKKKSKYKSITRVKVCDELLYGTRTVQDIADELNISYHAVYEIYRKMLTSIADMINHNKDCAYYINMAPDFYGAYEVISKKEI